MRNEIAEYNRSMASEVATAMGQNVVKELEAIVAQEPASTASSIAQRLGLSVRQMQRIMARLQKEGRLVRHGGRKEGRWEVVSPITSVD